MDIVCSECGGDGNIDEWFENNRGFPSGKVKCQCSDCGQTLAIRFYCRDCDVYHGGRVQLQRYDTGSVTKYCCPDCDGLIRKGEVLDVTQGPHR